MKHILCPLFFIAWAYSSFSQQDKSILPFSFSLHDKSPADIRKIQMPAFDLNRAQEQDKIEEEAGLPYRFGNNFDVEINVTVEGTWSRLTDGRRICRLAIQSENARFIHLLFKSFQLKGNSALFVYNEDRTEILGAFTAKNVLPSGKYAAGFIKGDKCILEINEYPEYAGTSEIIISRIVHGYRGIFRRDKNFGDSGPCNNNVNCPEGTPWQNQKKAVALTIVDGNRACSGSLINNARNDGTPYFLTANHCLSGDYDTWMFVFNYESPSCSSLDGNTGENVVGAVLMATDYPSDFALFKLYDSPHFFYDVFYAGWSNEDMVSDSCAAIHHPAGDVKKITFDYGTNQSSEYYSTADDGTHWMIWNWESGTTEGGSSGSPLFNKEKRIIGQLHGGYASCSVIEQDWYGKLAYSWDNGALPEERLKDWLDPDNTGILFIDGASFSPTPLALDAAVINADVPGSVCGDPVAPVITIRNNGTNTLTSLELRLFLDNVLIESVPWNGSLAFSQMTTVIFSPLNLAAGAHQLVCYSSAPNNLPDLGPGNDTAKKIISAFTSKKIIVNYKAGFSDYWNFILRDKNENEVYRSSYYYDETGTEEICVDTGCYTLALYDWFGDGISSPDYFVVTAGNDTVAESPSFSDSIRIQFCNFDTIAPPPPPPPPSYNPPLASAASVAIFPNPAQNKLIIYNAESNDPVLQITVRNLLGKEQTLDWSKHPASPAVEIDTKHWAAGLYVVHVITAKRSFSKKIVKIN